MFSSYYMDQRGHVYPNKVNQDDVRVVVISPEDREQVKRLVMACPADWAFDQDAETVSECTDQMQAALRGLIAPPKPDEPTGLGAVVEDADGVRWTRVEPGGVNYTRNPWYPADDADKQPAEYADINAVRVLTGGVA